MHWFALLLALVFVILCIMIILVILMQPGQSEGLAGTFGSGGMLGSAFGVHIKNRLAKFTTILVVIFFAIIFTFALAFRSGEEESPFKESSLKQPSPATEEKKGGSGDMTPLPPKKKENRSGTVKEPAKEAGGKKPSPEGNVPPGKEGAEKEPGAE